MKVRWNDNTPICRQLKERVSGMMRDGALKAADALASVRHVAAGYQLRGSPLKALLRKALPITVLLALHATAQAGVLQDHQGHWLGDLKLPDGRTLKIGAELFTRADGSPWASFASPDQGAFDIPVKSIHETGDSVDLDLSWATMKMTWANDHFNGEFKQGPGVFTMELKQVAAFPRKLRPQTPKVPLPYKEETLSIASADGVMLGATLSVPNGKAHPNVVVLVPGSGPSTRDEDILGHQPFAVLADYLARNGVAVLRYDKRGIGRSTGDYQQHTAAQLIDDVNAVVRALKGRKQFKRLGLIGHSEGSGIAAAAAGRNPGSVDFVVSLAGIGVSGLDVVLLQDRIQARDHGASPEEADRIMTYVRKYYDIVLAQADVEPRIAALKSLYDGLPAEDKELVVKYRMNVGTLSLGQAAAPALRALLMSNPPLDWRAVHGPVLVLNGSLDHQVPAEEDVGGIVAALKAGGNRKVESAILPSLNHLFQTAKTGRQDEYDTIDETMAPVVLERIAAFARKQK